MSNIKLANGRVLFPEKERAFVVNSGANAPFTTAVIGVTYPDPNYSIERRAINELTVFEYVAEGEGEILIDGQWRRVSAGDTYILAPGVPHRYRAIAANPYKKYWVNYISDYMSTYLSAYNIKTGIFHVNSLPYFERLHEITKNKTLLREDVYSIATYIHAIIDLVAMEGAKEDTADKIKSRIASSVYAKLALEDIAEELHISKSGVIRIFRKKFGTTPYEYLLNEKMEIAKTLLKTTSLSVAQIAEKLSVLDEHYFSTLFYKRTGTRPLKYRHGES